jgi:hypothetical protein
VRAPFGGPVIFGGVRMRLPKQGKFYADKYGENYFSAEQCSFTSCDMIATITVPQLLDSDGGEIPGIKHTFVLGELQTFSYSMNTNKFPVHSASFYSPKAFTRGPRNFAGSLIFATFDQHIMRNISSELIKRYSVKSDNGIYSTITRRILSDDMPPFNITITFVNEHGNASMLRVYGVEIVNEGQVMSVQEMATETTMTYVARDIIPMERIIRDNNVEHYNTDKMIINNKSNIITRKLHDYYIYGKILNQEGDVPYDAITYNARIKLDNGTSIMYNFSEDGLFFAYTASEPVSLEVLLYDEVIPSTVDINGHEWNITIEEVL